MKSILYGLLLVANATSAILQTNNPRKLIGELPNDSNPEYYLQQIQNTHQTMNNMMVENRRQGELKNIANNFDDLERRLNQFRDNLNRKLNELEMSLERPKIPQLGPGPMMMHPYTNPMMNVSSTIARNPMNTFAGMSSFVPAPSYKTTYSPFSSNYSDLQNTTPYSQQNATLGDQENRPPVNQKINEFQQASNNESLGQSGSQSSLKR